MRRRHAIPMVPVKTGTCTLGTIFIRSIIELGFKYSLAYPGSWILGGGRGVVLGVKTLFYSSKIIHTVTVPAMHWPSSPSSPLPRRPQDGGIPLPIFFDAPT